MNNLDKSEDEHQRKYVEFLIRRRKSNLQALLESSLSIISVVILTYTIGRLFIEHVTK